MANRGYLVVTNRHESAIQIVLMLFNSYERPIRWNATKEDITLMKGEQTTLPVMGAGRVWIKYALSTTDTRLAMFDVTYDAQGRPYPYILGGDKWNQMLREAAMGGDCGDTDE